MKSIRSLTGLHLLLTYRCTFECDHCFVWGSPRQEGTMTAEKICRIIDQAREVKTIEWIYFEGGEPFLYYPILLTGIDYAKQHNFNVGIVTNGYWAIDLMDTKIWLEPLKGKIDYLSVSSDLFHFSVETSQESVNIQKISEILDIPTGIISIPQPENDLVHGSLMYRGRAAEMLAKGYETRFIDSLVECPYEDLSSPERFHVDPLGYLHICQGIVAGNLFQTPLDKILASYDPLQHPIIYSLIKGGPLMLAQKYNIVTRSFYADACQLCYETRKIIRAQYGQYLQPDQIYGIYG